MSEPRGETVAPGSARPGTDPSVVQRRASGDKDVRLEGVVKRFPVSKKETLLAVDRIDLHVAADEFVAFPGEGLISLVWLVGLWSLVFGVSSLSLAYRLHKIDAAQADPAAAH